MARAILLLLTLGLFGAACIPLAAKTANLGTSRPVREYRVEAKQFSFAPNEIRVQSGAQVRLIVTSADVDHRLANTGINPERETVQGRQQTLEFLAWPPGTYAFQCKVVCGMNHEQMAGTLVIE